MAKKGQKITFFPAAPEKMFKNKKYFGFFLVSYISIQKKKCTSEQFLQGRPRGGGGKRSKKKKIVKKCKFESAQLNYRLLWIYWMNFIRY